MGTLMKNGIPYGGGGGDNSKTVTYEQYKNLSEAEKNSDTTYFVSDYPEVDNVTQLGFIDTSKVLSEYRNIAPGTTEDYIATEDCIAIVKLYSYGNQNSYANVDGVRVLECIHTHATVTDDYISIRSMIPLKKGQTLSMYSLAAYASQFGVYGIGYSDIGGSSGSVEIVDSLDSTDTDKALSANMGRELKENLEYYDVSITPASGVALTSTSFIHKRKFDGSVHHAIIITSGVSVNANGSAKIADLSESISTYRTFPCAIMSSSGLFKGTAVIVWFVKSLYITSNVAITNTDLIYCSN